MTGQPKEPNFDEDGNRVFSAAELRMARRKARRMGLNPNNGREAVQMLEERGVPIDNNEVNMIDAAAAQNPTKVETQSKKPQNNQSKSAQPDDAPNMLVTTKPPDTALAIQPKKANQPAVISAEERQKEVAKLEKQIKKRRGQKLRGMVRRVLLFVILPTIFVGIYYYNFATPMYATHANLHIEKASSTSTGDGARGLLDGTSFASSPDAIAMQNFLQSRAAFELLENDYPYVDLFKGENIDRFHRLPEDANEEQRYKVYKKNVKVTYDSTDSLLRLEVRSPEKQPSEDVANLMIQYAEERIDEQTQRVRDTGVQDAMLLLEKAESELRASEMKIAELQENQQTVSPTADKEILIEEIATLKGQKSEVETELQELLSVQNPNGPRVRAAESKISILDNRIAEVTQEANALDQDGTSITRLELNMRIAESDLTLRQQQQSSALENLSKAQSEARSQRKFLTTSLPPTATFRPIYPKKLIATISALLIFFGIYIFVAITVDVLREQISA